MSDLITPVLVVFREILQGDIRKYQSQSNNAPTGGGARDLRFRNGLEMSRVLSRMFTNPTEESGVTRGPVYWKSDNGRIGQCEIEFWRPTDARPNEVRLGKIHLIDKWDVEVDSYMQDLQNHLRWFYLLVLDDSGRTWARLLLERNLASENQMFREVVRRRSMERRGNSAVFGSLDFVTGEIVP